MNHLNNSSMVKSQLKAPTLVKQQNLNKNEQDKQKTQTQLNNTNKNASIIQAQKQQQQIQQDQSANARTKEIQKLNQQSISQASNIDDFNEDLLDDSMELQEASTHQKTNQTQTKPIQSGSSITSMPNSSQQKTQRSPQITQEQSPTGQTQSNCSISATDQQKLINNNKIYQSSPSKLNNKLNVFSTSNIPLNNQASQSIINNDQKQEVLQGSQSIITQVTVPALQKQQNIKPSVISGKKSIISLQNNCKPLEQLELNLSMQNLTIILPEKISNMNLRIIDLRSNKIEVLPQEFFSLINLWKIQLDSNQLHSLPNNFDQLISLRIFTASNNKITEIPHSIFKVEGLEKLDLSSNQIKVLPSSIGKNFKLKSLLLQDNFLIQIPPEISYLRNLSQFGLEWFQYLKPNFEKVIQKQDIHVQGISQNKNQQSHDQNSNSISTTSSLIVQSQLPFEQVFSILVKLNQTLHEKDLQFEDVEYLTTQQQNHVQITFLELLMQYYKAESAMDLFNSQFVYKKTTVIHLLSKNNHIHLYDSLKEFKPSIDINLQNENGETPLMVALNEKHITMSERLLKDFRDLIEFDEIYSFDDNDMKDSQIISNSYIVAKKKQILSQHPLMIAVKKQMLETALRILSIIVKKYNKQKQILIQQSNSQGINNQQSQHLIASLLSLMNLNMKDENKNTLFHHLFGNFSSNMQLSVELCQELLKHSERCSMANQVGTQNNGTENNLDILSMMGDEFQIKLNEINKQGQTPLDIAIEIKQTQALEFAIYYNKNLLPALNDSQVIKRQKPKFDINANFNQKGLSPIHRAIQLQNYKAIYLLLNSGECNLFIKDKDFKTARDYCQKVLFLAKYIRKGEANFVRSYLFKSGAFKLFSVAPPSINENGRQSNVISTQEQKHQLQFNKNVNHNNINVFHLSKRSGRVKYNSWYTRIEQKNMMLTSSQQVTHEQNNDYSVENIENDPYGLKDKVDGISEGYEQQVIHTEDMQGDDNEMVLEPIDESEEGYGFSNNFKNSDDKRNVLNEMLISVKQGQLDNKNIYTKQDAQNKDSKVTYNIVGQPSQSVIQNSLKQPNFKEQQGIIQQSSQGSVRQQKSLSAYQQNADKSNKQQAQGQPQQTQQNNTSLLNGKPKQAQINIHNKQDSRLSIQDKRDSLNKNQPQKVQPIKKESFQGDSNAQPQNPKSQQTSIDKTQTKSIAVPIKNTYNMIDQNLNFENNQIINTSELQSEQQDDTGPVDIENGDEECDNESLSLVNIKNQYVMVANSSRLSRKPYYKLLQKNKFEREFCTLIDSKLTVWDKINYLYKFYIVIQQNKECSISDLKEGRDMLRFLKAELDNKEQQLQPLKLEIIYILDSLQHQLEAPHPTLYGMVHHSQINTVQPSRKTSQNIQQSLVSTNLLPSIKEKRTTSGGLQSVITQSNSRSLNKKTSNSNDKISGISNQTKNEGQSVQITAQVNNNNRSRIQSNYVIPQSNIQQNLENSVSKIQSTDKNNINSVGDRVMTQTGSQNIVIQNNVNDSSMNRLISNPSQKSLDGFSSLKQQVNATSTPLQISKVQSKNQTYGIKNKTLSTYSVSSTNNPVSRNVNIGLPASKQQQLQQSTTQITSEVEKQSNPPTSPKSSNTQISNKSKITPTSKTSSLTVKQTSKSRERAKVELNEQRNSISQQSLKQKHHGGALPKESCVKKFEVTIDVSKMQNQSQKWKQLTINPNAVPSATSQTQPQGQQTQQTIVPTHSSQLSQSSQERSGQDQSNIQSQSQSNQVIANGRTSNIGKGTSSNIRQPQKKLSSISNNIGTSSKISTPQSQKGMSTPMSKNVIIGQQVNNQIIQNSNFGIKTSSTSLQTISKSVQQKTNQQTTSKVGTGNQIQSSQKSSAQQSQDNTVTNKSQIKQQNANQQQIDLSKRDSIMTDSKSSDIKSNEISSQSQVVNLKSVKSEVQNFSTQVTASQQSQLQSSENVVVKVQSKVTTKTSSTSMISKLKGPSKIGTGKQGQPSQINTSKIFTNK